jgi:hypothetical protein
MAWERGRLARVHAHRGDVVMSAHVHAIIFGHSGAVPLPHTETRVVRRILHPTAAQCRGDPVGRPAGPWWAGTRDEVARRQDPPSPGAARRPLPARQRRLFSAVQLHVQTITPSHQATSTPLPRPG